MIGHNNPPPSKYAVIQAILNNEALSSRDKCIAIQIILRSNSEFEDAHPGASSLARAASVKRRDTVFDSLARLENEGFKRYSRGLGRSNGYSIDYTRIMSKKTEAAILKEYFDKTSPEKQDGFEDELVRQNRTGSNMNPSASTGRLSKADVSNPSASTGRVLADPSGKSGHDPSGESGHNPSLYPKRKEEEEGRCDFFDDGGPGVKPNGSAFHVKCMDGDTFDIPYDLIKEHGKQIAMLSSEQSLNLAKQVLLTWVSDGIPRNPDSGKKYKPASSLFGWMRTQFQKNNSTSNVVADVKKRSDIDADEWLRRNKAARARVQ